jgi:hypothetical protein
MLATDVFFFIIRNGLMLLLLNRRLFLGFEEARLVKDMLF